MIIFDTETCGFYGPIVLIQWAEDDGEIHLYSPWTETIQETLKLIEYFCEHPGGVCGFNLTFDWFHICQFYTTLSLLAEKVGYDAYPEDHINTYAMLEPEARDGVCCKPQTALDLMLHARKGPYQSMMDRSDVRIKRVPTALAWELANFLDNAIPLKDVYFARKKDPKKRWTVMDVHDDFGDMIPDFKDILLKFSPSSALKALAQDALGVKSDVIYKFADVEPAVHPVELGYAPYALAIGDEKDWKGAWPEIIHIHISHWTYNSIARKYALDDVIYTRGLYHYFKQPSVGDDDSILACMVGSVRWRGFQIDIPALKERRDAAQKTIDDLPFNQNSVAVVRKYLYQVMDETEKLVIRESTKGIILESITKWRVEIVCDDCQGEGCHDCDDGLIKTEEYHPAAIRARAILDARKCKKEIELYDKLILAGRFHASFKVIGTLSSRMSGSDGLNAQGINHDKKVRACFTLAWPGMQLSGGDFKGFEVTLMDAAYNDPDLRKELLSGKKIHGIFGQYLFPPMTYDEIVATDGLPGDQDKYTRSKNGVFAIFYGGEAFTLVNRVGVDQEVAEKAYLKFTAKYKKWGEERKKTFDAFCSMRQPGGIGSKVEWHEPAEYIESLFGFKRFFTLENTICRQLFDLANDPPKHWFKIKMKVVRRDKEQTATGACRSALFAAAFALQASNMRAAANHRIQSAGGTICKGLQRQIWEIQPTGIEDWRVMPMNIHDEIQCPTVPEYAESVENTVNEYVDSLKDRVPLIDIDWHRDIASWADK